MEHCKEGIIMNKEQLRELLVEKYDYKNSQVDGVVDKIMRFSPIVAAAFNKWLETGVTDDTSAEGYTIQSIIEKKPMKVVSAYITLDWLEREPDLAKLALNERQFSNPLSSQ
jgi:hypothetical protein